MIVARSRNHVIGKDNQMPWKISADLQFRPPDKAHANFSRDREKELYIIAFKNQYVLRAQIEIARNCLGEHALWAN